MGSVVSKIVNLSLDEIDMGERLRPVSAAGVQALKASIRDIGRIKDPIHVRKTKKGKFVLLAGAHRLVAARQLRSEGVEGFDRIAVTCWACNDNFARLLEIDDNLAGADLTPLDTAVFLAQRKDVYERMHPEARAQVGAALAARRWDAADMMSVASFAKTIAEQMGISDRHVRRLVKVGQALGPDEVGKLRTAEKPIGTVDLIELSKIDNSTDRFDVVRVLAEGTAKNVSEAIKSVKAERGEAEPVKTDFDQKLERLFDAWSRASIKARRAFAAECAADLQELMAELGGDQ